MKDMNATKACLNKYTIALILTVALMNWHNTSITPLSKATEEEYTKQVPTKFVFTFTLPSEADIFVNYNCQVHYVSQRPQADGSYMYAKAHQGRT